MRKIITDLAVSLDGFIEGPRGETDWCIMDEEMGFEHFLEDIDAIFYGRISYDHWGQFQPDDSLPTAEKQLWEAVHQKKKYVFTHTPRPNSAEATYLHADIAGQVRAIQQMPGKNIWLYGGASLIASFAELDLIDEYRLSVHPVILGGGKPLFPRRQQRVNLQLLETKAFRSGVTLLRYQTIRQA